MAPASKLWLVALLSFVSVSLAARPVPRPASRIARRHTMDEIELPPSVPPKIRMTDAPADPRGKLVKMRYGPYRLRANSTYPTGRADFMNQPKIHKPCDECFLGAFQGDLEYADGSIANVNTGVYMHHFVVVNNNKPDWVCPYKRGQYIYNSGNERPPVRLNSKYSYGMLVNRADTFSAAVELMNMSAEDKIVYATVIYEVIPINTPDYREATHLRIDVWMCGGSHVTAKTGAYIYNSMNYTSPYAGVILHTDGHGHSGTTDVSLWINDSVFCNSRQYYALRPSWIQPPSIAMHHDRRNTHGMKFISDAGACEDYGYLSVGDRLRTEAFYNDAEYAQLKMHGRLDPQMGIHFLYIGMDDDRPRQPLLPPGINMADMMSRPGSPPGSPRNAPKNGFPKLGSPNGGRGGPIPNWGPPNGNPANGPPFWGSQNGNTANGAPSWGSPIGNTPQGTPSWGSPTGNTAQGTPSWGSPAGNTANGKSSWAPQRV